MNGSFSTLIILKTILLKTILLGLRFKPKASQDYDKLVDTRNICSQNHLPVLTNRPSLRAIFLKMRHGAPASFSARLARRHRSRRLGSASGTNKLTKSDATFSHE